MKFMTNLERLAVVIVMILLFANLNACIMMPLMMGPVLYEETKKTAKTDVNGVLNELVQGSVDALIVNRGPYKRILIGKTESRDGLIPAQKLRMTILQTLRSKNVVQVYNRDDHAIDTELERLPSESKRDARLAMLNVQLSHASGQIWLAQQLVDLPTKQNYWSAIFSKSVSRTSKR
jgi:hypothetical protein